MIEECAPVDFQWDGEIMRPAPRFRVQCDRQFVVGEHYTLEQRLERSIASHRAFFAEVNEAWRNLPEPLAEAYPTPDALRKFALIKAGYCDAHPFVCASRAEALRLAAYLKPVDTYAVITVKESIVTRYTAQSQSLRAMGKETFQASKSAVLEIVAEMVGVSASTLSANVGRAA